MINSHIGSSRVPPPIPTPKTPQLPFHGVDWLQKLLACNPFYLLSAALLLYGIAHASDRRAFFEDHQLQLSFNFLSLQIYEALLVGTSVLLFRRKTHYDATLLTFLEAGFLMIPFLLVSQAGFLGNQALLLVIGIGGLLALIRLACFRQFCPSLHFPKMLLTFGRLLIILNVALPLIFRHLSKDHLAWVPNAQSLAWFTVLPALSLIFLWLPVKTESSKILSERTWIPFGLATLWIVGTGVQLWCIGYVYDLGFGLHCIAPTLWISGWIAHFRISRRDPQYSLSTTRTLLFLPFIVPWLSVTHPETGIFNILMLLNSIFCAGHFVKAKIEFPRQLALLSTACFIASFPGTWGESNRIELLLWGAGFLLIAESFVAPSSPTTLFASFGVAGASALLFRNSDMVSLIASQNGFAFFLLQSLLWNRSDHQQNRIIRTIATLFWVLISLLGMDTSHPLHKIMLTTYGMSMLSLGLLIRIIWQRWIMIAAPIGGAGLTLLPHLSTVSLPGKGITSIVLGFLLFGVGTWVAWTRKRKDCALDLIQPES